MAKARVAGVLIICMMLLTMVAPHMATAAFNPVSSKPTNVAPYNAATEIGPSFTFLYSYPDPAPETAIGKRVQYRTASGNYSTPLFDSGWVAIDTVTVYPEGLFAYGTTYYWRIRVQDNLGYWTLWSDETSFTTITNSVPSQPENFEPDNSANSVTLPVTLQSSEFRDPNAAELVLGEKDTHAASQWQATLNSDNYVSPVFDSGRVTAALTSITVPLGTLAENTTYYWHVRHQDSYGNWSAYSPQTSFTTGTTADVDPIQKPVNVSPYNGATEISPDQKLTASGFESPSGRSHYASRWQVAGSDTHLKNPDGSYQQTLYDSSVNLNNKVTTALPVGIVDYGKTYYWHVKYQDDTGMWSAWSEETSFTVVENLAPGQPRNLEPSDNLSNVQTAPTLKASAFTDPDMSAYVALTDSQGGSQWQVTATAGTYAAPVWEKTFTGAITSAAVDPGKLAAGTTYYWHVRYQDSLGNWSGYSQETSFTTKGISIPVASFSADKTSATANEELVTFTENSTPVAEIDLWSWDSGDNTGENWTMDTRPPNGIVSHKYTKAGTYTVKLTVFNGAALQGKQKTAEIVVHAKPEASFTLTPAAPKAGKEITFTDASTPTSDITTWEWQFDDGTTVNWSADERRSADGKITHKFEKSGMHTVSLVVEGPLGTSVYNKQVNVIGVGGFKFGLWMIAAGVALVVVIAGVVYLLRARKGK